MSGSFQNAVTNPAIERKAAATLTTGKREDGSDYVQKVEITNGEEMGAGGLSQVEGKDEAGTPMTGRPFVLAAIDPEGNIIPLKASATGELIVVSEAFLEVE